MQGGLLSLTGHFSFQLLAFSPTTLRLTGTTVASARSRIMGASDAFLSATSECLQLSSNPLQGSASLHLLPTCCPLTNLFIHLLLQRPSSCPSVLLFFGSPPRRGSPFWLLPMSRASVPETSWDAVAGSYKGCVTAS